MDKAFAELAAIFANSPQRKPGRHPLSPGMLTYDLVRRRNGDLVFLPSVGEVPVSKALCNMSGSCGAVPAAGIAAS